jgi:LysM repeat protein
MRHFPIYIFVILILLLYSCSPARKASRSGSPGAASPTYAMDYVNRYSGLAVSEMRRTGIPASITLAQGMLESNYGRSTLATKGNNHFGIKCHSDWKGRKIYHDDNRKGECFRSYPTVEDSYRDHSDFLTTGSRYKDLFRLSSTDYKGWAHGLKKAGYATDPKYATLLISKIEDYGLHAYDTGSAVPAAAQASATPDLKQTTGQQPATTVPQQTTGQQPAATAPKQTTGQQPAATVQKTADTVLIPEVRTSAEPVQAQPENQTPIKVISLNTGRKVLENNGVQYIIAREGDTYKSIAEEYELLALEVSRYNDLPPEAPLKPGQFIYLQPKRSKAAEGNAIHIVKAGETMYFLSQKYAVKLSSLYKMNVMEEGTECVPGQKVRIR